MNNKRKKKQDKLGGVYSYFVAFLPSLLFRVYLNYAFPFPFYTSWLVATISNFSNTYTMKLNSEENKG
jgi:riboflavin transporter FmnP